MADKNNFITNLPFAQRRSYLRWFKITASMGIIMILSLTFWSFKTFLACRGLLEEQNALEQTVNKFDELVRKKNKLLADRNKDTKHSRRNQGQHEKIADYLTKIEAGLVKGVYLSSFEFTLKKIEITGYSNNIKNLSDTITNLQQLAFIKNHELEQVSKGKKETGDKLGFTVVLNL